MLSQFLLPPATLAALAVAQGQTYSDTIAGGPYGSVAGDYGSEQDHERFAQANQNPNATQSFEFAPFFVDGVFNDGQNTPDEQNVWTLRINVSDFRVPDAQPAFPGEQPAFVDPHVTNTVLELGWDEDESFRSALNGSTAPACVAVTSGNFLPNVTNLFTDDNDSADCEPVLGQECINAILASDSDTSECSFGIWENLPECAASFGASRSYDQYGLSRLSFDLNSNNTANNASYEEAGYAAIANGTGGQYGFLSVSTEAYNGTNSTIYEEAATRLYVMALKISPYQGQQGLWTRKLMCVRANATQLAVENEDSSSGEDSEGGGSGGDSDASDNVASTPTPSALFLAALAMGMLALL